MLLALTVVIFAILVPKNVPGGLSFGFPSMNTGYNFGLPTSEPSTSSYQSSGPTPTSLFASAITLGAGSASGANQPAEEFVTIENRGATAIDITGWRIENGKNKRTYAAGSTQVHYASDSSVIPQGTKVISASGGSALQNIVLKPGERANIITGSPGNFGFPQVVSFKENKCTRYLAETYRFPATIEKSCVRPIDEPGSQGLDRACQDYVEGVRSCHTPKFDTIDAQGHTTDQNGATCTGCVDGTAGLSGVCTTFIKEHLSYRGCLANHLSDTNFEGSVWHIYLYRPFEMWATNRETISLYDSFGRLVTSYSY